MLCTGVKMFFFVERKYITHIKQQNVLTYFHTFLQGSPEKSVPYFERATENGDWQAMFQLGVIYYDGLGGVTDHVS